MNTLKIIKGRRATPIRGVIYGVEGVGKSTLGACLPNPLFLDVEGSTNQLDVARVDINSWSNLSTSIAHLAADPQGFSSVVIDTADWAERLCIEEVLRKHGKKSIEDFGFGKGYTHVQEEFSRTLTLCDGLISKGVHVVWVAHSKVVRQSPPDQTDGFDRYELKLTKQIAPLLKEWSDLLLFFKFKVQMVEGTDGRIKATGGKERVLHTTNSAAWDAKNRYGLPEILVVGQGLPKEVSAVFAGAVAPELKPATPAVAPVIAPAIIPAPVAITEEQVAKLLHYNSVSICAAIIAKALDHYNESAIDMLTEEQAAKVIARCQEEMNKPSEKPALKPAAPVGPVFPWPERIAAWLSEHEATVNAYLASIKYLQPGQTFRQLDGDKAEKIVLRPANFAMAAKIPAMKEAA